MISRTAVLTFVLVLFQGTGFAQPDPGPPKTLTLPANEVGLFGHSTDPLHDVVQWSLLDGPGAAKFSAPWALHTSLKMTVPGVYTVQLMVNGASAETTVTLQDPSQATSFYVDPGFAGIGNGSPASPWSDFRDGNPINAVQWQLINQALAQGDVNIFFSANQEIVEDVNADAIVRVYRTDTSPHRLSLDGISMINTPSGWVSNPGPSRTRLVASGGCCISIGWDDNVLKDNITVRGFEITGESGRVVWGGSFSVMEYLWIHDVSVLGSTFQFTPAVHDGTCIPIGIAHDVAIRHNLLERNIGESIYIASNYNYAEDGGCVDGPFSGDNHYDFLIESNEIDEPGFYGEEGDGIDLKAGIYNVTVRGNFISHLRGSGVTMLGQMPNSTHLSNYLIENNIIEDAFPPWYSAINIGGTKGLVIRNNVLRNCAPGSYGAIASGIRATNPDGTPLTPTNAQIQVLSNTSDACFGFGFNNVDDVLVARNNLMIDASGSAISSTALDSDYNLFVGSVPSTEGTHSVPWPTTDDLVLELGVDDHLAPTSPAIGRGIPLPGFNVDLEGNLRNPSTWDIGAYVSSLSDPKTQTQRRK